MSLDKSQQDHISFLERRAMRLVRTKYTKGATEHSGHIWDLSEMQLIDNAIEEAVDQLVYLLTLKDKIEARVLSR